MSFHVIKNIQIPASTATRNRPRGEFANALDNLEIGDGFEYESEGTLKSQYPRVAPKKFGGSKRFKIWAVEDGTSEDGKTHTYGVARIEDRVAGADAGADEGDDE